MSFWILFSIYHTQDLHILWWFRKFASFILVLMNLRRWNVLFFKKNLSIITDSLYCSSLGWVRPGVWWAMSCKFTMFAFFNTLDVKVNCYLLEIFIGFLISCFNIIYDAKCIQTTYFVIKFYFYVEQFNEIRTINSYFRL